MVGWHHRLGGHEFQQTQEMVKDREAWYAAVHGAAELDTTEWLNWTDIYIYIYMHTPHTDPSLSLSIDGYWGCSHVLAIEIILQWIWRCIYLFELVFSFSLDIYLGIGFTGSLAGKECTCNAGDLGSIPVGKIPWRRAWQPIPVFWPGKSPWTEEPGGLQSTGLQSQTWLSDWARTHTRVWDCWIVW